MTEKKGRSPRRPTVSARMMRLLSVLVLFALAAPLAAAQVDGPIVYLKRGQLWSSYTYAKTGAPFNNWRRINFAMDWPGYDPEFVTADVGGPASYLLSGGIYFSSLDSRGKANALDDFAIYASSTSTEPGAKYLVTEHRKVYGERGNAWLAANPNDAEEVVASSWRINPGWVPQFTGDRQHPIRARRTIRQWGGSQRDENYMLIEYTIKNTGDSTLFDAYAMLTYAFGANSRAQTVLFPTLTEGPRNNQFFYFPQVGVSGFPGNTVTRALVTYGDDYPETAGRDEALGFAPAFGPRGTGEFLAPGYAALKVVNVTPNKAGRVTPAGVAWVPVDPQQDQQGPFVGLTGFDQQYGVLKNPLTARNASGSPSASFMKRSRTWSLMSFGPYDIAPGDSIRVAYAEAMGGVSYNQATTTGDGSNGTTSVQAVKAAGLQQVLLNAARAQFAYDHRYNVPDPPPAPPVEVSLFGEEVGTIANVVTWPNTYDAHADTDYTGAEALDLAGYRLYRSSYLPIGPWDLVADVPKGDAATLRGSTYTFIDRTVQQGNAYYYALTAYDAGHATWPVNPAARLPETNSNRVPPLESSLYANRTQLAFKATIPPTDALADVLVVPNPFVASSGLTNPGVQDQIQFVNIPSPCTIRIYTMRGTLVQKIEHDDGSGIAFWNQETASGQFVESGVYVYHVETPGGATRVGKLAIVR